MRLARTIAAAILGLTLGLAGVVLFFAVRTIGVPMAPDQPPLIVQLPFYVPILIAFSAVGTLVASHRPGNPIGWLFSLAALLFAVALAIGGFATDVRASGSAAEKAFVAALNEQDPISLVVVIFEFIVLLYPTGHLPSRRWVPVAAFVVLAGIVGPLYTGAGHELFGLAPPLALAAPFVRFRHASPIERRQIEWFVYFLALTTVAFILSASLGESDLGGLLWAGGVFFAGMTAVAAGIAILRYRLYDIDLLINRTLVYGPTTATIGAAFFGGIVVVQTVLRPLTGGSELAVAVTTLGCFALFQPLRRRIQSVVDKRFYRSRYDAARILDAFSVRLRDEVHLEAIRAELLDAVAGTVQPVSASVWLRERAVGVAPAGATRGAA